MLTARRPTFWWPMKHITWVRPIIESYLVTDKILQVAKDAVWTQFTRVMALSENGEFANACIEAGITFIGPSAEAMKVMGSKTAAREKMVAAGIPCVPGSDGAIATEEEALRLRPVWVHYVKSSGRRRW